MPISPMTSNTASATIAAAGAPRRAKRRCASLLAAIARKVVPGVVVRGALVADGAAQRSTAADWDWKEVDRQPLLLPRPRRLPRFWEDYLDGVRKAGSSGGAVMEIVAEGAPAGWARRSTASSMPRLAAALMVDQCGEGCRDRRGLRRRRALRRGERRRDARRQ